MKYKCMVRDSMDLWLTEGKVYEAETVVSPKEFSGGRYIFIVKADDGYPAYAHANQFIPQHEGNFEGLSV